MIADARQLRREVFDAQAEPQVDPATASIRDHAREFGRLDNLATQMRNAGASKTAVTWMTRQADIAYRAARSEGRSPLARGAAS